MLIALATLGGCLESGSGPDGSGAGYFALAPVLPAQVQNGQFPLGVDGIGLRLQRASTGETVVDTLIHFDPDSAAVHAALRIGMLRRVEEFEARLSLQAGTLVLFAGSKLIFLQQGPPGTNRLDSIGVRYEGPGRDIAEIAIQPPEAILRLGDSLQLRVAAVDSNGAPVQRFFVSWSVSDGTPGRLNALGWIRALNTRSAATVIATTPNGAADTARATFVPDPTHLWLVGADTVVAPVGAALAFGVQVVAADSLGVPGVPVRFSAATAGGVVTDSVVVSDSTGLAATQVLVGNSPRAYRFEAHAEGLEAGRLTVDGVAGPPAELAIAAGDTQSGPVGTELAQPVTVRVRDALGNPVAGQRVNFVVTSGGGSVWAGSNNTNDSGVAMERWTLGTSTAVPQRLEARAVDNTTGAPLLFAGFTATALPGPADSVERLGGDGQLGVVGWALAESLAVRVRDGYGNPVPDTPVGWSAAEGSVAGTAATDPQGIARARWVMGPTAGVHHATATVSDLPVVAFTAAASAGPPAVMTIAGGTPQTGVVGSVLAESLVVRVSDAYGNGVGGASLTWSTPDGGAVTGLGSTGASGEVRATWRLGPRAGTQQASARIGDLGVTFAANAVAGPVAAVAVSAPERLLTALGAELTLGVAVSDTFGNALAGQTVTWSSSDSSVAVVDGSGRVTARGNGPVRITGTAGEVSGFVDLSVAQAVAALHVAAAGDTLDALGDTVQVVGVARDANGYQVPAVRVSWTSSDAAVASVDQAGLVTSHGNGGVTITGAAGSATSSLALTVSQVTATVQLTPARTTLAEVGSSVQLQLVALDHNGNPVSGQAVTWASSDTNVARVSDAGLVTAVGEGQVTITATVSGSVVETLVLSVTVSVEPPPPPPPPVVAAIHLTPVADTLTVVGDTVRLMAVAVDSADAPVPGAAVQWSISDPAVAQVSDAGLVTAVGNGMAIVTATSGTISATARVSVALETLHVLIDVHPGQGANSINLDFDGDTPVAILTTPAFDAATADPGSVRFAGAAATHSAVEDADGDGDLDLVLQFTTRLLQLTASSISAELTGTTRAGQPFAGEDSVSIVAPPPPPPPPPPAAASVEVTPVSLTFGALGETARLSATVRDSAGTVMVGEPVAWSVLGDSAVSVSDSGVVTAVGNGGALVVASTGGVSGSVTVIVAQVAASLEVTPDSVSLTAAGATQQFSASVLDATGHLMSGLPVAWASGDLSVATVDGAGVARAVATGRATLSASVAGVRDTAVVIVSIPDTLIAVVIDIKPGQGNGINLESEGNTPVAVLTTSTAAGEPVTFDAATVVSGSVRFAGVAPRHAALDDVDGDGDLDLILQFDTQRLELTATSTSAALVGWTSGGRRIRGEDRVAVTGTSSAANRKGK